MKSLLNNWTVMRGLRLLIGIFALVQAVAQRDIIVGVLGIFLLATALANVGCCGANGCAVNFKSPEKTEEEITYEELDAKQ